MSILLICAFIVLPCLVFETCFWSSFVLSSSLPYSLYAMLNSFSIALRSSCFSSHSASSSVFFFFCSSILLLISCICLAFEENSTVSVLFVPLKLIELVKLFFILLILLKFEKLLTKFPEFKNVIPILSNLLCL